MASPTYRAYNIASASLVGTAAAGTQATSATINTPRTMLQIAPSTVNGLRVIEWGYSLSAAPGANAVFELIDTATVFASGLTAHVAGGIQKVNFGGSGAASTAQLGTALTGYAAGATTEGTLGTANRLIDAHFENGLFYKWRSELGRECEVPAGNCLRLRVTPTSAVALNVLVWCEWEE